MPSGFVLALFELMLKGGISSNILSIPYISIVALEWAVQLYHMGHEKDIQTSLFNWGGDSATNKCAPGLGSSHQPHPDLNLPFFFFFPPPFFMFSLVSGKSELFPLSPSCWCFTGDSAFPALLCDGALEVPHPYSEPLGGISNSHVLLFANHTHRDRSDLT